jgi:4'-phosphopantetheinyl transferase
VKLLILAGDDEPLDRAGAVPCLDGPQLEVGEVHVWAGSLRKPVVGPAALAGMLSADEASRASALGSAAERRRFLASRGQLRLLLAGYLRIGPRAIRLGRGTNGKPILTSRAGQPPLRFSVSHSGEHVLYALSRAGEVGADVQRVQPELEWSGLAARFFAPEETCRLRAGGPAAGREGFYRLWTQKEAMAKAAGGPLLSWLGEDVSRQTPEWQVWSWRLRTCAVSVALRSHEMAC